jgi:hypothetical protein
LSSNRIDTSRHVTFDEHSLPFADRTITSTPDAYEFLDAPPDIVLTIPIGSPQLFSLHVIPMEFRRRTHCHMWLTTSPHGTPYGISIVPRTAMCGLGHPSHTCASLWRTTMCGFRCFSHIDTCGPRRILYTHPACSHSPALFCITHDTCSRFSTHLQAMSACSYGSST